MKENTRFCTRSLRDNTRFGGLIYFSEFSPYPNTNASYGSYCAGKISSDRGFDERCRKNMIKQVQKLKTKQSTEKEVDEFVY